MESKAYISSFGKYIALIFLILYLTGDFEPLEKDLACKPHFGLRRIRYLQI